MSKLHVMYDDGYAADAVISTVDGLQEGSRLELETPLRITYRPAGVVETNRYYSKLTSAKSTEASAEVMAEFVSEHVDTWSLRDRKGNPVPVTAEACKKVVAPIVNRLAEVITGRSAPDEGGINLETEVKN